MKSQSEKKNNSEHISSQSLTKKIGSTTYIINVHFGEHANETFEDKVKRLMKKEVEAL